ncbi:HYR-like domain-containing protein [Brumimicrobium oceani]|nr:PKD domain-containing protein [Brumimicrobium oceani]
MTDGDTITTCTGMFYDTGGPSGNYTNGENLTYTICPSNGMSTRVDFVSFNTEFYYDQFTIYDGDNVGAPPIGTYSGATGPGFVEASPSNASGCLTFVFTANLSGSNVGWEGVISCKPACQDFSSNFSFSPAPDPDGVIRICQGTTVSMTGSGTYPFNNTEYTQSDATSTFSWSTQDGVNPVGQNVSHTFNNDGGYLIQLQMEDIEGCSNTNITNQEIRVSTTPEFTGTEAVPEEICIGDQSVLTGVVTPVTFDRICDQPVFPPIALPDGTGVSYSTSVNIECFLPNQSLTDIDDLLSICVNMEHSFLGDLGVIIECPSGQTVNLVDFNFGVGAHLGSPIDNDNFPFAQGIGFDYCWTPNATNGTLAANGTSGISIPAGSYESENPMDALVGCDLNGVWTLTFTDDWASDNGFVFDWSLNFNTGIIPPSIAFTPVIVSENWQADPTIVSGTNPINVEPPALGSSCYTYEATDNFGCSYDTTICVNVNPFPIINPIPDVNQCLPYTLPAITGANLSGSEAYYTGTGGTGTQYNPGDIISSTTTMYIYDSGLPAFCEDETSFLITIYPVTLTINCPPNLTANCNISEQPPYANLTAFENAGGSVSVSAGASILPSTFTLLSEVSDNNSCPETVTRTYQIQDDCGNTETCTQIITINDDINPTGTAPAGMAFQCVTDIPAANSSLVTNVNDNCTAHPIVTHLGDVSDGNTCPEIITRTYRITDNCGNFTDLTQDFTINDDILPTGTAPADITVQCIGDVPLPNVLEITDEADNCTVNPIVTHVSDVSDGNTCPEIITRTYNITDDCGNNIDVVQTITVSDDIAPTGTAPANVTVQCVGDVPMADVNLITDEADNCTTNPIVTFVGDVSDGNTCPEQITRTYRITDDCGNSTDLIQLITINDDINPTGTAPADLTVQCIDDVPANDISLITDEADNCTVNPTVTFVGDVSNGNTCPELITRTYRITDDCGNFTDLNQIITVNDDIHPTGTAPANVTVQCIGDVPIPDVSLITDEADNCTVNPIVTHVSDVSDGNACPEIITRTYNIADDCGNNIDVVQTITVNDDIFPTGTAPADLAVQCIGDVPIPDVLEIADEADNCTVNPIVTHVSDISDGNTCPEVITRTYNIADDCGNNIDVVQTITVNDDILPTGTAPADLTVQCIGDVPIPNVLEITDEADNCTVNPIVTHVSDVSDGNTCPEIITRTYNIADDCGNNIDVIQTITVNDDIAPTGTAPANVTVQCIGDVPLPNVLEITDEADNCTVNPIVTHVSDVSDGNTCPEQITRTYRITDDCGNFTDLVQFITINDDILPTGTAPVDLTVQCIGDVPVHDISLITDEADNCTVNPTVTFVSDVSDGNTCPEVITRTYNIADDCGNNIDVVQTITVNDDVNPTASNPAPLVVQCLTDVPPVDISVVTDEADNCTVNPIVAFSSESTDGNSCNGEIISRIYSVTDDCGNSINVTHEITIASYTPTFTVSGTGTGSCGGSDGTITLSGLDPNTSYEMSYDGGPTNTITTNAAGEYVITGLIAGSYTNFTVSDIDCPSCTTTENVSININDPTSGLIDAGPDAFYCEGTTIVLSANNPDGAILSWDNGITDGVGFVPPVGVTYYTVTADLTNCFSSDQVMITVSPAITDITCPGDLTAVCDISEQAAYANFDEFIAAGGSATIPAGGIIDSSSFILLSEVSNGNSCPKIITRTYQIADTCGVTVSCSQDIVINDLINPTATAPSDTTVQCIGDVPAVDITAITDEADNCTANPIVTHVSDVSDGNLCPETITRTYNIADACGNNIDVIQIITVDDDINPTGTAPADVTLQCIEDLPAADINLITDEADNCTAIPTVTHVSDVSDGNTCPEIITRTYNIADDCGNSINVLQTFTINDTILPTGTAPADVALQCLADLPAVDVLAITDEADNCTVNPTVTHVSDVSDGNTCPEVITRTYNIADDCGNNIDLVQTFTINDDILPTGSAAPLAVQCIGDVPAPDVNYITDEADNCTVNPTVTHVSDVSDGNTCPEVITRTYNIADDCGNNIDVTQIITINDTILPTGTAPADVTVQCISDVPAVDISAITDEADNCTVIPIVTHVSDVSDGNTCPEIITRTYNIADDCGNNIDVVQTITINDDIAPTATAPSDTTVQCIGDVPMADIALITDEVDNCTANPAVIHLSDISDGNTCPEVITRTYRITDDCGNNTDITQIITINDTILPTGTAPADLAFQCLSDIPAADINAITDEADNCTVNPIVTHVGDVSDGNTCPEVITRTYNIADSCGNNIDVTQVFTINDTLLPTGTAPADLALQCLADVPAVDVLAITDEADNCTVNPIVTHVSDVSDGNTCPEVIVRTYNIADSCGNNIDVTQTFTINDDILPTASNASDLTVECSSDVPAVNISVITDEADNCTANPTVAFVSESTDGNTCNGEVITRIYSVTDDCGNSIDVSHTITIDSYTPPTFTLSSTGPTTCSGSDGTITLSGLGVSTNYQLSYDGGASNPITTNAAGEYVITGLTAGSYIDFTVYDEDCPTCFVTVTETINLSDPDAPAIDAGLDQEHCEEALVILNAINPENANISWDNGVVDGVGFVSPVGTTNYTVTAELANCFSSDVVSVLIHPAPAVSAGSDIDGCLDSEFVLTGSGASSYVWDNGVVDGVGFSQGEGTTTYSVIGTSIHGCKNIDQVDITVHPFPIVDFMADTLTGCYPLEVNFTSLLHELTDICTFTINGETMTPGITANYTFNTVKCYDIQLRVESQYGCITDYSKADYICVGEYPTADFSVNPTPLTSFETAASFTNESIGSETYNWSFGDGETSVLTDPTHNYSPEKEEVKAYTVELIAYSDYGCADTVYKALPYVADLVYYIPNSFTPNADINNETFKPVFHSGYDPKNYQLTIFNRWGELLFESNDVNYGWDGSYGVDGGRLVQDGVYIWKIEFKKESDTERIEISGHVNLIR